MTAPWTAPVAFATTWRDAVAARGDSPFLVFEGPDRATSGWTHAEFDGVVRRAAGLLRHHGVGAGDAVHLALTNSPTFVAVWLAANGLGVPSDPAGPAPELRSHLQRTRPRIGFCAGARRAAYREAAEGEPLAIVEADAVLDLFGDDGAEHVDVDVRARAAVMFTSGTTSAPKGVENTQANYAFTGATMATASGLEVEQVLSAHPGVLEAAVVGQPDRIRDEVPVGFVVAADPAAPSVADLMDWCSPRLTKSKQPRDITLLDQLPRTSVGKIRKFPLRDAARAAVSREHTSLPGATP